MANIVFTVLSLLILSAAIFFREKEIKFPSKMPSNTQVLAATSSVSPTPTDIPVKTLQLAGWVYPDSLVTISTDLETDYISNVDPKVIFNWYRDKIGKGGYHATSMIQTSTNNKILDKIVASGTAGGVAIEIVKDGGNTTYVKVSVSI